MKKKHLHRPSAFSPQIFQIHFWMWKDIRGLDLSSQDHSIRIHTGPESRNVEKFSKLIPAISFLDGLSEFIFKKIKDFKLYACIMLLLSVESTIT